MGDRWYIRARDIEKVDAPEFLLSGIKRKSPFFQHRRDEQHIGTVTIQLKVVGHSFPQDRRRKRPERFAILDLEIHHGLHFGISRVPENTAPSERPWSEFHTPLEPSHYFSLSQFLGDQAA